MVMKQLGAHSNLLKKTVNIYPLLREPQMGRRGLYLTFLKRFHDNVKVMMDFLSCCDGTLSVLDIAESQFAA